MKFHHFICKFVRAWLMRVISTFMSLTFCKSYYFLPRTKYVSRRKVHVWNMRAPPVTLCDGQHGQYQEWSRWVWCRGGAQTPRHGARAESEWCDVCNTRVWQWAGLVLQCYAPRSPVHIRCPVCHHHPVISEISSHPDPVLLINRENFMNSE